MQCKSKYSFYSQPRQMVGMILLAVSMLMPLEGLAQSLPAHSNRQLQAGDVINVTVPGRPNLDRALTLDASGRVTVEQIGSIALAGLTASEAALVLRQKLRLFDPSLEKVDVSLESDEELGMKFYLIGQVLRPGEYSFNTIPSYWDLLRTAGGPTENSNLRQVRLVREIEGRTQVTELDLSGLFEGGDVPSEPLLAGDTLVIPAVLAGVSAVPTAGGVKVFGAVEVPTVVDIREPTPMLDVLMLAGAPSADSELTKIFWVHHVGDVPEARVVDLTSYLKMGNPVGNPLVYPGDTVKVEYFRESWARRTLPWVLGSLAAMATIWLAYDRVTNGN